MLDIILGFSLSYLLVRFIISLRELIRIQKILNPIISKECEKIIEANKINIVKEFVEDKTLKIFLPKKTYMIYNQLNDEDKLELTTMNVFKKSFGEYMDCTIKIITEETFNSVYNSVVSFEIKNPFEFGIKFCYFALINFDFINYKMLESYKQR